VFKGYHVVLKIVIVQLGMILLAMIAVAWIDWVAAYSIALGGLVASVPGAFFAWRMNYDVGSGQALRSLVMGQVGNLGISVVMFAAVFNWVRPLNVLMFFVALALIILMNILVPLVQTQRGQRSNDQKAN
jgi:ATP synthase protein I